MNNYTTKNHILLITGDQWQFIICLFSSLSVGSKYDIFAACSLTMHNPALLSICSKHFPRRLNRVPPSSAFSLTVSHRNCNIELSVSNVLIDWNILNMQSNIRDVSVDFLAKSVFYLFPTEGLLTLRQTNVVCATGPIF